MNKEEEDVPTVSVDLTIGGVKVRFPCKPYPAQTVLMSKIIAGIKNSQNCLLESPTGSGKTLALLCASLAWQAEEHAKKRKLDAENFKLQQESLVNDGTKACDSCDCALKTGAVKDEVLSDDDDVMVVDDDEDDDFKPTPKPKSKPVTPFTQKTIKQENEIPFECECGCHLPKAKVVKIEEYHVPRIYYGTRTHKQIAQLTSELGRTAYRNAKMDILASREHTCINEAVARGANKNEECKKLLEQPGGYGCPFKTKVPKLDDFEKLYEAGIRKSWDLESFVDVCRTKSVCPYFASRELFTKADIIFCPYSYLIDPFIRNTMNIALKRDIVIFDEAHNIEDACREAASVQITSREIDEILRSRTGWETPLMMTTLERVSNYIQEEAAKITDTEVGGQMVTSEIFGGPDLVARLENRLGLNHATCAQLNTDLMNLVGAKQSDEMIDKNQRGGKSSKNDPAVSVKFATMLEHLLGICDFIQRDGNKHADDFRMLVSKQQVTVEDHGTPKPGEWRGRNRGGGGFRHEINYALHFWCLNPAIVFQSIVENARCIVLASGTLSPMLTFQSELGTTFPIQFEAGHVIGKSQVFAGCVGVSPRNKPLQAVYKNTETFDFQDGIGELVEEVCSVTPGGVLLFLTSYRLIDKMVERWRNTGTYGRLANLKRIFVETSGATAHFEETLSEFYASCGKPQQGDAKDEVVTDDEDAVIEDAVGGSDDDSDETTQSGRPLFMGNRLVQPAKKRKLDEKVSRVRKAGVTPMSQRGKTTNLFSRKTQPASGGGNGALFLAVYRGKVSEGLNFADDYARAVIAVGIPYPALKDPLVQEKRSYNEMHSKHRDILSGGEWYECQAFRALNQALGRCIRHRRDWGAIVLVDERFTIPKFRGNEKISKWVRERRTMFSNFPFFRKSLVDFIQSEKFEGETSNPPNKVAVAPPPKFLPDQSSSKVQPSQPALQPMKLPKLSQAFVPKFTLTPVGPAASTQAKPVVTIQPIKSIQSPPANKPASTFFAQSPPAVTSQAPVPAMVEDSLPDDDFIHSWQSSTSPDVFDSAISEPERSVSSSTANSSPPPPPAAVQAKPTSCFRPFVNPVQQKVAPSPSPFIARCSRCREELFFGNCTFQSTTFPNKAPNFILQFYEKSSRQLPTSVHIGDVGKFGVRLHDQLVNALIRVEGQMAINVIGNSNTLNANFDAEDMVAYETYVCKCSCGMKGIGDADVFCWSIVGVQPGTTSGSVAELLNKVIFNPYAALLSKAMSSDDH